ncbi:MAG: MFS transporter, partial [Okeania sp. SIO2H7]|nr:MFS transporter [Okeania sp. SIO2H7]
DKIDTTAPESSPPGSETGLQKWLQAFRDQPFIFYILANLFVTTYTAQLSSTLPLYLANFIPGGNTATGFSEQWISYFFVWHSLFKILLQLPITRWVKQFTPSNVLIAALGCWMISFGVIWLTKQSLPISAIGIAALILMAFTLVGIGEMLYGPTASGTVGQMAPPHLRGIYFSLDSQCWALGYMIGPALGGWALDHPNVLGANIWLVFAISVVAAIALTQQLKQHRIVSP